MNADERLFDPRRTRRGRSKSWEGADYPLDLRVLCPSVDGQTVGCYDMSTVYRLPETTRLMIKTFVYKLRPTKAQQATLAETLETCRQLYNNALRERKEAWEE